MVRLIQEIAETENLERDIKGETRNLAKVACDGVALARLLGFQTGSVKTAYHDRDGFDRIILVVEDKSLPEVSIAEEPNVISLTMQDRPIVVGWD